MENASDDFPSKRSLKISFQTSPTSLWESLVFNFCTFLCTLRDNMACTKAQMLRRIVQKCATSAFIGGSQKGGFQKGGFGGCSPGTKTGTRVRSPKPPFWKPPFYLPMTLFGVDKRVVSKRVVSADVPPERKPERGYVRQNHPFTKPPFYLPVILCNTPFRYTKGDRRALFKRALCSLPDFWPQPPHASLPSLVFPPFLSVASTPSEVKWAITSPKKGQATQRCYEEQLSKCTPRVPKECALESQKSPKRV